MLSMNQQEKPPYRVPLMAEIRTRPWNGFKVASTFSGAGGSCTGYLMAGYRVIWANEFVPAAQASYRANHPDTFLDVRDIRQVRAEEILAQTGLNVGDLDLFDGSPPCQAFSTAGKRHKGWGKEKIYEHGAKQCNETLFSEYIRLVRGLQPKVFVAENVSGLVKGSAKGYFLEILRSMKASGYRVSCRVLDAQWLGVPQMRQRAIFIGVRNDLNLDPVHPKPLPYRYSVREALPGFDGQMVTAGNERHTLAGRFNIIEHDEGGQWSQGDISTLPVPTVRSGRAGTMFIRSPAVFRDCRGSFGKAGEITDQPAPAVIAGTAGNFWVEGANGFNGHAYQDAEQPMPTVQAGRPVNDVDRTKRKFTIAELKRVCAFPDDYILTGSYAQQWERLGNSVPPVMMFYIADTIRKHVLEKSNG